MTNYLSLKKLVLISLLAAIGYLIMLIAFPIPMLPGFLTLDFSDLPALIGAIILGPVAGILIETIKNILHILLSSSLTVVPIGELANLLAGSIMICMVCFFYHRSHSLLSLLTGMICGTLAMTLLMTIANYFLIFPGYALFLGVSEQSLVAGAQAANRSIHSLLTLVVYGVMPFNLLKGIVLTAIILPVCLRLRRFLDRHAAA
ncbi:MAG: ECF transporter S component [Sporolactobacillus sp.]